MEEIMPDAAQTLNEKENENITPESESENKLPESENENKAPKSTPDNKKYWFAGGSGFLVLLVIIISVVITLNMQKNDPAPSDGSLTPSDTSSECVENANLTNGSVTTTIDGKSVTYNAAYLVDGINATVCSGTYESTTDNQVTFLVINGGSLKIDGDITIKKSGSTDFQGRGDEYSFYGTNSVITVVGDGSSASVNGATIASDVSGANAIVATNGGNVSVEESIISTTKDGSRGLHATFGGYINADSVKITTEGGSSASLATDRGEGTVVANNMTLSTAGAGSPLIYSTGAITVTNSTGTSTGAQIAVVEGKNSVTLQGCDFSATGKGNRGNVDNAGVMIYQSMSGDAGEGTGTFTATDSKLAVDSSDIYDAVPFFFVTNTNATINLTGTTLDFSKEQVLLSAKGTSEWGRSGVNGGNVTISLSDTNATNTETDVDSISSVTGL